MSVLHETGLITAPLPVYFETFAPAAATGRPTVVMVHGGAHTGACYQRTADGRRGWAYLVAERGYRTVVPDWPGTGRSGYIPLDRLDGATVVAALFGRMIREARIHFAAVIEEARIAGLDTGAIAVMLGKLNIELADSIRPELWTRVEQLLAERAVRKRAQRRDTR